MPSILAVCVTDRVSGGEHYLLNLLEALSYRGWEVKLLGGPSGELAHLASEHGLSYRTERLGPKLGRRTGLRTIRTFHAQRRTLWRVIAEENPNVVLLQYKLEQLLAHSDLSSPYVFLEHGPIPAPICRFPPLRHLYVTSARSAAALFAASSPATAAYEALGLESAFLEGGVKISGPTRPAPGRMSGAFAGRLEANKGILEAISLVLRSPGHTLAIAGSGSLEDSVARAAEAHPTRIRFLGQIDSVDDLLQNSDFGILLTRDPGEGRPLFALECLARGRPVVTTNESAAMNSLADEFGPTAIHRLSANEIEAGVLNEAHSRPIAEFSMSWDETAAVFDRHVSAAIRM